MITIDRDASQPWTQDDLAKVGEHVTALIELLREAVAAPATPLVERNAKRAISDLETANIRLHPDDTFKS